MQRNIFIVAAASLIAWQSWAVCQTVPGDGPTTMDVPRAPEQGGPRRWQVVDGGFVSLRNAPALDAPVIADVTDDAILSNLGCETADGRVWCRIKTIRGKLRGYAPARYLRPARGPDGTVPVGTDDSGLRAGKNDFDVQDLIPCAQERGETMGECAVGVARGGGGDATAVVSFPNGFKRALYFVHGAFISANATMSGTGSDTDWRVDGGIHVIRVDDQRYELPGELIFGQ